MSKVFIIILLAGFMLLEVNCQENINKEVQVIKPSFIKINGSLILKTKDKSCLIADDAIDYEAYLSSNNKIIAVETLLMSNLQTIRIYLKNSNDCYSPMKDAFSTKVWGILSKQKNFKIEDISHPRMKFIKWIDNKQLVIELYGEIDSKVIDENITYLISSP